MKRKILLIFAALILIPTLLSAGFTSQAAGKKQSSGFVKEKNGTHYYYKNGKQAKGRVTINGHTYILTVRVSCRKKAGIRPKGEIPIISGKWYSREGQTGDQR